MSKTKSGFKNWQRITALFLVFIFSAEQISYADRLNDAYSSIKSTLKSSVTSAKTSYNSGTQSMRTNYTAATKVYNAVKSVTGISVSSIATNSILSNNPLSTISVPVTTYNYLANPSTKGNLGKSYGAANTLQTDFALTIPQRVYDFTGWVDGVSGLNSNLGTKLYQSSSLARSISDAYSGAKVRTESSLKQTYGVGTYNNFIKPTENFIADNAIITVATLGTGSVAGLAGSTLGRVGSVSRIAEPIISRLPQITQYVPKVSQYVPTGVKNLISNPTARVELGRAGEIAQKLYTPIARGLTRETTAVVNSGGLSAGKWLVTYSIRAAQYEAGLYVFRQSGLENALVPTAYRPAVDTTLDYVLPFFIAPGRGGVAKETTKAFFSPGGIKTFAQTGIEHLGSLKNKATFGTLKAAVGTLPAKLTRESIKSGIFNAGKAWAKEAKLGYANLASEGKIWVPVQMLRQGVHVAQDLAVFQAGSAVFLGALNKAGGYERINIPYTNIGFDTLKFKNLSDAANTISEYAAGGAISGLTFGGGMSIVGPVIGPVVSRTPVLGRFMRRYDNTYGNKLFETAGLEKRLAGKSFWSKQGTALINKFNRGQSFLTEEFWIFREPAAAFVFDALKIPAGASEYLQEAITDYGKHGPSSLSFGLDALKKMQSGEAQKTIGETLNSAYGSLIGVGNDISRSIGGIKLPNPFPVVAAAAPGTPVTEPPITQSASTPVSLRGHEAPEAISTAQPTTFNVNARTNTIPSISIQGGGVTRDYLGEQIASAKGSVEAQKFLTAYNEDHRQAGSDLPGRQMAALTSSPALESSPAIPLAKSDFLIKPAEAPKVDGTKQVNAGLQLPEFTIVNFEDELQETAKKMQNGEAAKKYLFDQIKQINKSVGWGEETEENLMNQQENISLLAKDSLSNEIVGYANMYIFRGYGYIPRLATHNDWQRNGIATKIFYAAVEQARIKGLGEIQLEFENNTKIDLHKFYRNLAPEFNPTFEKEGEKTKVTYHIAKMLENVSKPNGKEGPEVTAITPIGKGTTQYVHNGVPITDKQINEAFSQFFKGVSVVMRRISDPLNAYNPFSSVREARKFVNKYPQFKAIEQDLREMTRGLDRRDVEILFSLVQNYTGILKTTDDFKSLFTIIETNKKNSSLNSFSNDIITFSSIPAVKEKIGSVQDLEPLAEVLRDINDISLIKGLPFDSIKSRITTTKDLKLLPELQKISGNIKGVFEIANLPEVKNLTPKFEDLKPIADLVRDNPVDRIRNANRFIFYVLKQSPKTIAEWKGLADRFSISSERSQYFEKVFNDLRIEFPEKDIINAFLKYNDGFFITLDRLKSEYGGVLPSIKKLGLETVSAGLDHSAYRDEDGYGIIVRSSEIDKALMHLGDQWWNEDGRLFTTFEKLRNEIGADNLLKAFKERGLLRVERSIYGMKKTPILMDVAKEIGILNFLKLEGFAFMAVEKDPQSFAKGFKIVEKEFNKDIIEKVAMGDNFSDINVYSRSNFVLVSQVLGKAPSLIVAVKEIGLPRLIDVMNYGKSSDNDYLEQKPLEFVEGFNIIQKEFNDEIDKVLRNEDESTKHWVCNGLVRLSQMAKDEPKVSDFIKLFGLKDLSLAVSFSKNNSYKGFDSISTLSKFGNEIVDLSNESASFKAYAPHMVYSLYVLPGLLNKFSNTAADTKLTLKTVSEIAQAFGSPKVVEAITYYADNNDSKIKSVNDLVSMKSEIVDLSKESAAFKAYASSMAEYLPGILNKFSNLAADTKLTLKTVSEIAQAFGSPKVFEVIADDTNNNDSKIKSVNDLVSLKLKISDIGKNFHNLEAKVTEAKVTNFDTRDILKLVIIDKELEYAKRATDFIIQENNQIMLQTKSILLGNLLRQAYHPEVFTSITKFAKEKVDRADSLSFFRAMNNFISQSVMEKQDTLQDWQLLLSDYTNRFGYLANKDMVLVHRYLSRNEPLESAKLAGYALKNMGITSTGEKGIGEFELAIKSLSKKLLEEGEIKEEDINNPIAKGIIGGLTGYSSATWGHGRYKDLSVFVSEFDRAKEQGLIPALEAAYNEKYIFSVRKIGKIEFSKDVNDALLKYQNWVKQGIDLSSKPLAEQLKQFKAEIGKRLDKQLELIQDNSKDNSYVKNEISKINTLKDSLSESADLLEVLKNVVVKMSGNIRFIEEPMAIGLIVHTLNSYPNQRIELSKVLEQGPLFNFVPKLIALKDEFIKENILKDLDKVIQKPLLNLFKFNQIEKELSEVSYLKETAKIEAFATKGILGEMAGDIGDACYTKQHLITSIKHLTPVIFTSGKGLDKKLVGSMLILENSQDNKPVLIMRAINPRDDFISEYSSEDFVKGAIEYAEQIAKVKDAVVFAPVKVSGSITNRHGFIDTAIEKFVTGNAIKLDRTENFNGYDITNGCVEVKSAVIGDVP